MTHWMKKSPTSARLVGFVLAALIGLLAAATVHAAPVRETAAAGYWTNAATWVGSVPPAEGDAAMILHPVTLDESTPALAAFSNSATVTFMGWETALTASVVTINGTITHPVQDATTTNAAGDWVPDHRVWIVCSNLTVTPGGRIQVDARGYRGGGGGIHGAGPGGGLNGWTGNGAGHGGRGGLSSHASAIYAESYATAETPWQPGSGSGGRGAANSGGYGGGAVHIEAEDLVTVNGAITAHGANGSGGGFDGGGSGGAIRIDCGALTGSGFIGASGAHGATDGGSRGGGGAGGRIAVHYDPARQALVNQTGLPTISYAANNGWAFTTTLIDENAIVAIGVRRYSGEIGTLYFTDDSFFPPPATQGGRIVIPGGLNAARDGLTVSNGILSLPPGSRLVLTNDLVIRHNFGGLQMTNGVLDIGGRLDAATDHHAFSYVGCNTGTAFRIGGGMTIGNRYTFRLYGRSDPDGEPTRADIAGDLVVTNAGRFFIYAGATNGMTHSHGMMIATPHDLHIAAHSSVAPRSHPTNGGSVFFQVRNLTIQPNGMIDATGGGFGGGANYGSGWQHHGFGPGGGRNAWTGSGAGHGGDGGSISGSMPGGGSYGSAANPLLPGSGAGGRDNCYGNPGRVGSAGGGLIRIEASDRVTVHGTIRADGETAGKDFFGGGGSGGGIYIVCHTLAGSNGLITANGARGITDGPNFGGGGGGGRIALHYDPAAQAAMHPNAVSNLRIAANHGPCWNGSTISHETFYPGQPGSIWLTDDRFFPQSVLEGGRLIIPAVTRLERDAITIYNSRAILDGIDLIVANDLVIANNFAGIEITNGTLTVGGDLRAFCTHFGYSYLYPTPEQPLTVTSHFALTNRYTMRVHGHPNQLTVAAIGADLTVSHGSRLHLYSGATNASTPDYGLRIDVAESILTAADGWIHPYAHPVNGGMPLLTADRVTLAENSGINADQTGFAGGYFGANTSNQGYGPGGGTTSGGAGHGGAGSGSNAGGVYGSETAPLDAGSGGGGYNAGHHGSRGGGSIRLDIVDRFTLHGRLHANGSRVGTHGGGSAGGGIHVRCRSFTGNATGNLTAHGGASSNPGGGGGGGRIVIRYGDAFSQNVQPYRIRMEPVPPPEYSGGYGANGGSGGSTQADDGTIRFIRVLFPFGTQVLVR